MTTTPTSEIVALRRDVRRLEDERDDAVASARQHHAVALACAALFFALAVMWAIAEGPS